MVFSLLFEATFSQHKFYKTFPCLCGTVVSIRKRPQTPGWEKDWLALQVIQEEILSEGAQIQKRGAEVTCAFTCIRRNKQTKLGILIGIVLSIKINLGRIDFFGQH